MEKLRPDETKLVGGVLVREATLENDDVANRIHDLTTNYLQRMGDSNDGWSVLYRDPGDHRFWELTYPQGSLHGGGTPMLSVMTPEAARQRYGSRIQGLDTQT